MHDRRLEPEQQSLQTTMEIGIVHISFMQRIQVDILVTKPATERCVVLHADDGMTVAVGRHPIDSVLAGVNIIDL